MMLAGITGCLRVSADDLYCLPQVSETYIKLQTQLNMALSQGAEYSPPTGGQNRQAVQLKDLNGNGVNDVLAFFSVPGESTLKICIFELKDGDYSLVETIEGSGTAIESVRYVDMDGDGVKEIIVGWQMSPALKYFTVCSIKNFHSVMLAREEYSDLIVFDINKDGNEDIITIRLPTQDAAAAAQVLSLMPDGEIVSEEARLSVGVEAISRVLTGKLTDGTPAVFIDCEGRYENGGLLTDILAFKKGAFMNISLTAPGGISEETVRTRMNSSDIDKNGVVEIPIPGLLKAQSETAYYAIDWYAFNSAGKRQLELTTYHNNSDEWYLILPRDWRGKVSVRREDIFAGERTVIFSYIVDEAGPYEDFLKIYRLSGKISEERAKLPGRTVLLTEGMSTYAFELLAPPNSFGLTFDAVLIRENFRLIYSDWLAGTG